MSNLNRRILACLALAAALGCPAAWAKQEEGTVAVVNGSPILLSEYQKELSSAMEFWAHNEPDAMRDPANVKKLKETTLEELINREVLYQEGSRQKIKVRDRDIENGTNEIKQRFGHDESGKEVSEAEAEAAFEKQLKADGLSLAQFRDRLSKQIMARKLIDEAVKAKVKPPEDKEVKAYFDRVKAYIMSKSTAVPGGMDEEAAVAFRQIAQQVKAMSAERVRVSRILIKVSPDAKDNEKKRARRTAVDIRERLLEGTSTFAEVAKAESEDPESAARNGDIGYVLRGVSPPDFEKAAFALPVGEISEPVLTDAGYNLLRVSEKRASEPPDYERFKDDLGKFLAQSVFQKDLEAFIKGLKAKAIIERSLPAAL